MNDVSGAAQETGRMANDALAASKELSTVAETLQGEVGDFLSKVRAG